MKNDLDFKFKNLNFFKFKKFLILFIAKDKHYVNVIKYGELYLD